jgi:ribonuclease P protein subunit RPR2
VTIRVVVAHDDPRIRAAAGEALRDLPDVAVVAAVDSDELVRTCERHAPEVVVVDLACGHGRPPRIGLPLVAIAEDGPVAQAVVDLGARGLLAPTELAELAGIVRRVAAGDIAISTTMAPRLVGEMLRTHDESVDANAALEFAREALAAQLEEMRTNYRATVEALTNAVELRDEYTGGHVRRVCDYSLALARLVAPALSEEPFVFGYMLHDIGKLAIPDSVLLKPGALTEAEYELVKTHTTLGAGYISRIPFLLPALAVVRSHHERWDGAGYPDGLEGETIPLIARIFTIADSLDAMTTDRPYRVARPLEAALEEFDRCSASQFDPGMVRALHWVVRNDDTFAPLRAGVVPGRDEVTFPQDAGR